MAPSKRDDRRKSENVGGYRAGEKSAHIAAAFGCSANTVSRTVRSLLSADEYAELKIQRAAKGTALEISASESSAPDSAPSTNAESSKEIVGREADGDAVEEEDGNGDGESQILALNDAEDFGGADLDDNETFNTDDENVFHEIAVLPVDLPQVTTQQVICRPFASELLPDSVYMLVDKTVELDPRPLSEFPELGLSDPSEQQRQALCLYASPRAAKRQCGRSQRVIKVPDTQVFEQTSSYLLARGITHLVVEGSLFSLKS